MSRREGGEAEASITAGLSPTLGATRVGTSSEGSGGGGGGGGGAIHLEEVVEGSTCIVRGTKVN